MKNLGLAISIASLAVGSFAGTAQAKATLLRCDKPAEGIVYGKLAAHWWQWVLETPAPVNPVLDTTDADCAVGQTGPIWYLAGAWGGGTLERTCTVPFGRLLFFPAINTAYGAFLTDPANQRTESFLRAQVACAKDAVTSVSIDGNTADACYEESALFDVVLPADNIYGVGPDVIPQLTFSPTVDAGYYTLVKPLKPGQHTIHIVGEGCGITQDVTYHLTVAR